jgi:uncharacterized membrane protein YvlD (DUF360 family)
MKTFLRTYLICFLSVYLTQLVIGGFEYVSISHNSYYIFVLALALVHFFVFPLLYLFGLPSKGLGGLFLRTVLIGLVTYVSTAAIQGFAVRSTFLPEVRIKDITLPSKSLNPLESLAALSLTYSIISTFFIWLCKGKK